MRAATMYSTNSFYLLLEGVAGADSAASQPPARFLVGPSSSEPVMSQRRRFLGASPLAPLPFTAFSVPSFAFSAIWVCRFF